MKYPEYVLTRRILFFCFKYQRKPKKKELKQNKKRERIDNTQSCRNNKLIKEGKSSTHKHTQRDTHKKYANNKGLIFFV